MRAALVQSAGVHFGGLSWRDIGDASPGAYTKEPRHYPHLSKRVSLQSPNLSHWSQLAVVGAAKTQGLARAKGPCPHGNWGTAAAQPAQPRPRPQARGDRSEPAK